MKHSLQNTVLERIKQEDISPKPKWEFLVKEYLVWASAGFLVVLGGVSIATAISIVVMGDWDILEFLGHTPLSYTLVSLPYAWIVSLLGFMFLADYNIRHTKTGYKFSLLKLMAGIVFSSVFLGILLCSIGVGLAVDRVMTQHVPLYTQVGNRRAINLMHPEFGALVGKVIDQHEDGWTVKDLRRTEWIVIVDEADILGDPSSLVGMPVRILGEREDTQQFVFEAFEIRALEHTRQQSLKERHPVNERVRQRMKHRTPQRNPVQNIAQ